MSLLETDYKNEESLKFLQKLRNNINAAEKNKPLPYPNILNDIQNSSNIYYKVDYLYQEIILACNQECIGNYDNQHLKNITDILKQKPEVINNQATSFMIPLLSKAVISGSIRVTQEILKFNPNLFIINSFGETPLNQGMKIVRTQFSEPIFYTCVEILKAHQKAGTIDNSVFINKIKKDQDCIQLMKEIITIY